MDFIRNTLQARHATQATYIDQKKEECHEATRDQILLDLDRWIIDPSKSDISDKRCWWITGQPGIGKSAIAATVAKCLRARCPISANATAEAGYVPKATLFSQFFINHTLAETTDPNNIFPTIALNLAATSPVAAVLIHDALKINPTLADKLSMEQVDALYIKPLSTIAEHDPGVTVSLFDGVDELSNANEKSLSSFTSILSRATDRLPPNVRLLVFSRPESCIVEQVDRFESSIHRFDLLTEKSREDVRRFLQAELAEIAERPGRCLPNWPSAEHLNHLCELAAGHLGWAALAVRWLDDEVNREGESQYIRQTVFKEVEAVREGDLYSLYAFILARVVPASAKEEAKLRYQRILGTLVILKTPQTIATIASLLRADYNVLRYFQRISSIIVNGVEAVDSQTIPRPHKSFFDWICSNHPEPRFRVNVKTQHNDLSMKCLEILKTSLHFNMADLTTSDTLDLLEQYGIDRNSFVWHNPTKLPLYEHLDPSIVYSCGSLFHHIAEAGQLDSDIVSGMAFFFSSMFLSWAEVACAHQFDFDFQTPLNIVGNLIPVCIKAQLEPTLTSLTRKTITTI
jgi:hypothetical protein